MGRCLGELVDASARPPAPESIAWYRFACFLPRELPYPVDALRARRCKHGKTQQVSLPEGFLEARDEDLVLEEVP